MYNKDYDMRNIDKKILDNKMVSFYILPNEIRHIKLWVNIGDEEDGKWGFIRPALVISKIGALFFVVPLTSKIKYNIFHYHITTGNMSERNSFIILSQGKVIDRKRFIRRIWHIHNPELAYIKKLLHRLYLPVA